MHFLDEIARRSRRAGEGVEAELVHAGRSHAYRDTGEPSHVKLPGLQRRASMVRRAYPGALAVDGTSRTSLADRMRRLLTIALALAAIAGCRSADGPGRVIVLGLDGMEPSVVDRMIDEGALPHFRTLRDRGASGLLRSSRPILSPIIWTTIATGKPPDAHGIGHFVATNPQTGKQLPVTSRMR